MNRTILELLVVVSVAGGILLTGCSKEAGGYEGMQPSPSAKAIQPQPAVAKTEPSAEPSTTITPAATPTPTPAPAVPSTTAPAAPGTTWTGTALRSGTYHRPQLMVDGKRYEMKTAEKTDAGVKDTLQKISDGDTSRYTVKGAVTQGDHGTTLMVESITKE